MRDVLLRVGNTRTVGHGQDFAEKEVLIQDEKNLMALHNQQVSFFVSNLNY